MARATRLSRTDFPTRPPRARVSNDLFSVAAWPLHAGVEPKFSCVVSKKTARQATLRNALKRRCREIVSPIVKAAKKPVAIVVYPKRAALDVSFAEARISLEALLVKLDI